MDLFGLYEGIGMDTPNKEAVICGRFIKKVSQMDGTLPAGLFVRGLQRVANLSYPVHNGFYQHLSA